MVLVEDTTSAVSPPCDLSPYSAIFLQVIFTTPPSRNISSLNVTFEGDNSRLTAGVYTDDTATASATGHSFVQGENIIDVSSVGAPITGFELAANAGSALGISALQYNGFTLCGTQATVVGDPHIKTLDGRHYTLMSQGTFSLWRCHGPV